MARRIRITTWYSRSGRPPVGSPRAVAVSRVIRALADADVLPGPADYESTKPPVGRAWVRRAPDRNLWIWYRFTVDEVAVLSVTTDPPVPVDE